MFDSSARPQPTRSSELCGHRQTASTPRKALTQEDANAWSHKVQQIVGCFDLSLARVESRPIVFFDVLYHVERRREQGSVTQKGLDWARMVGYD